MILFSLLLSFPVAISFSAARFSGFSYMEVHRFSFSSTMLNYDEVSLSFNTSSSNGLLLWVGGAANAGTDFMALEVNRGRVELRCVPHITHAWFDLLCVQ